MTKLKGAPWVRRSASQRLNCRVVKERPRSSSVTTSGGFSNTAAAGGHAIIDWTTLSSGSHTIGWLITDDCNRADGVGSRFFTVGTGTNLVAGNSAAMEPGPKVSVAREELLQRRM